MIKWVTRTSGRTWAGVARSQVTTHGRIAALVTLVAFVVYLSMLAPGVVGGDGGEFQFVPYVLGIPHPTGYPLYVLFGKLWIMLVPFGTVAYRMNLLSALAASLAVGVCFLLMASITDRIAAGLAAALALGANDWFWGNALMASVRPLHVLLILTILLLALQWRRRLLNGADASGTLSALVLVVGISLSHHRSATFVLPALALYIAGTQPALLRDARRLAALAALALLPNLSYSFLLVRGVFGGSFEQLPVFDLATWWALISGSTQTGARFTLEAGPMWQRMLTTMSWLSQSFSAAGLFAALAGVLWLARHARATLFLWGGASALTALLLTSLVAGTLLEWSFIMNLYVLIPLFLGAGVALLLDPLANIKPKRLRWTFQLLVSTALVGVVLWGVAFPAARLVQATNSSPLPPSRSILAGVQAIRLVEDSLPNLVPNATVLGDWEQVTPFWYYQYVLGWRPDVRLYYSVHNWRALGLEEQRFGRPLYLARKVPEMHGLRHLGMTGPLIHWAALAQRDAPPEAQSLSASFDHDFRLLGYRQRAVARNGWFARRPYIVLLSLWWQAGGALAKDYSISLRLMNSANRQVAQVDSLHPVLGLSPTSRWDAGEVVEDYYELRADPGDQSSSYHVEILVYSRGANGNLNNASLDDGEAKPLALPELTVSPEE